jgi:asparagine synthase (glutamine-hydrolysing)
VLPGFARSLVGRAAAAMPAGSKLGGLLDRTVTPLRRRYIGNAYIYRAREAERLLAGASSRGTRTVSEFDVTDPVYRQASGADRRSRDVRTGPAFDASGVPVRHQATALDDVATMQLVDVNTWLPGDILVKADRVSQAHGLELRTPFLDREVMAVASRLARVEKTAAGTTKFALREAVSSLLPQAVDERAKLGFPVPIGQWLGGGMYGYAEQVITTAQTGQWLDQRAALDVLRRFRAGDPGVTWRHVWLLVVFSLWHQIYVERAYDPVALGWTSN